MSNKPTRIYWDSCVYISCIQEEIGRIEALRDILRLATKGEVLFVASTLVIAEVTKLDRPDIASADQAKLIHAFFENDYISVRNVDRQTSEDAAEISRQFGLKPHDAIHVATAIRTQCDSLQTYDGEHGGAKKLLAFDRRIGQPALRIELPKVPQEVVLRLLSGE